MSSNARQRILEAAWTLIQERRTAAVTLAEIGAAAGVSRQAVYMHFDNRAGLLVAMARHQDERSGFQREMIAAAQLPPAAALERMVRLWCGYIPDILPVARALEAGQAAGEDGLRAWEDRMRELRGAFRSAVRGLHGEGLLAAGWSVTEATDWVFARTHLTTFDLLVTRRGWTPAAFTDRLVDSVVAELVAGG